MSDVIRKACCKCRADIDQERDEKFKCPVCAYDLYNVVTHSNEQEDQTWKDEAKNFIDMVPDLKEWAELGKHVPVWLGLLITLMVGKTCL